MSYGIKAILSPFQGLDRLRFRDLGLTPWANILRPFGAGSVYALPDVRAQEPNEVILVANMRLNEIEIQPDHLSSKILKLMR